MKFLPLCGRYNGNAKPIEASSSGNLLTNHVWETKKQLLCYNLEIRDTNAHVTPGAALDVSDYAINSLRVSNGLGVNLSVNLYDDISPNNDTYAANSENTPISFTIPASSYIQMITPEDIPQLNYLSKFKLMIVAASAPASGKLSIWLISKR